MVGPSRALCLSARNMRMCARALASRFVHLRLLNAEERRQVHIYSTLFYERLTDVRGVPLFSLRCSPRS